MFDIGVKFKKVEKDDRGPNIEVLIVQISFSSDVDGD